MGVGLVASVGIHATNSGRARHVALSAGRGLCRDVCRPLPIADVFRRILRRRNVAGVPGDTGGRFARRSARAHGVRDQAGWLPPRHDARQRHAARRRARGIVPMVHLADHETSHRRLERRPDHPARTDHNTAGQSTRRVGKPRRCSGCRGDGPPALPPTWRTDVRLLLPARWISDQLSALPRSLASCFSITISSPSCCSH
jgi:hypothetical protein